MTHEGRTARTRWIACLIGWSVFLPHPASAAAVQAWAVNDGEKVPRDALEHPCRLRNSAWDGTTIRLAGLRNEVLAFQVIVPARIRPVEIRSVVARFDDARLRTEIFSEHYLHVIKPTPDDQHAGWFWYAAAAPHGSTGWIPDALVPLNARRGRGGFPIPVGPGTQQGFWIDVAIPAAPHYDAGQRAGEFIIATADGARTIPIALVVGDADLPDGDAVKSMIYISDLERRHGRKDPALRDAYRKMAHAHRLDTVEDVGFADLPAFRPYLTGEAFTREHGYTGPGQHQGLKVFGIEFYGAALDGPREALWKKYDAYARWFKEEAPGVIPFIYLTDEPRADRYAWLKDQAALLHANPGPGGKLPLLVTMRPRPEVEGAVDIWATVADNVSLDQVGPQAAKGRRWWFYNGMRPMSGALTTDTWGTDPRVQPWIAFTRGIELWFYWESTHWQHNHQGPRAHLDQNVWVDPITFAGGDAEVMGDGTLFYPGEDVKFPDQDRGIRGPIASIRMKNLRRGQQDIGYLQLAAGAGHGAEARAIARTLIPRAFSEAKPDEPASWPERGDAWDEARAKIAALFLTSNP